MAQERQGAVTMRGRPLTLLGPVVKVGDKAPDFELDSTAGGKLKLSSLKGKNVLINVYVLDYSPT